MSKIVLPDGTGVTIWFPLKLKLGDVTNGKYHGGVDGKTVFAIAVIEGTTTYYVS